MCISAYLLPSAARGNSPLSPPVPHKSPRYLRFYSIIWYSHSLTFATTAGTQLVLEIWNLIPGPQYIRTYFVCLCMCFTADHKSCANQVRYIYVHRYIFMSLCSTWPRFMYVKTSSRGFNFGLFRRLSAPFHSCVRENRFTALRFQPPTHSGTLRLFGPGQQ